MISLTPSYLANHRLVELPRPETFPKAAENRILNHLAARIDRAANDVEQLEEVADEQCLPIPSLLQQDETKIAVEAALSPEKVLRTYLQNLGYLTRLEKRSLMRLDMASSPKIDLIITLQDKLHPIVLARWHSLDNSTREAWIQLVEASTGEGYNVEENLVDWVNGEFDR